MWNGSIEAQRQADAAWNAVKHVNRKKKRPSKKNPPKVDYHVYINSKAWRKKRDAAFRYWGRICELCGATESVLHVHHLTYARLGREKMKDLQILCADCHVTHHDMPIDSLSVEFRDVID